MELIETLHICCNDKKQHQIYDNVNIIVNITYYTLVVLILILILFVFITLTKKNNDSSPGTCPNLEQQIPIYQHKYHEYNDTEFISELKKSIVLLNTYYDKFNKMDIKKVEDMLIDMKTIQLIIIFVFLISCISFIFNVIVLLSLQCR